MWSNQVPGMYSNNYSLHSCKVSWQLLIIMGIIIDNSVVELYILLL